MVKLCKNYDLPKQPAADARFVRRTPSQTRFENQKPLLRYKRARIYSAELGRFISRDPLGFVDGMSLYRAYFVPNGMDPEGTDIWITQTTWHRDICVDLWTVCNENKAFVGRRCFSFGLSIFEIAPRDGVCCPGRVFETDSNPAPQYVAQKKTTCKEDKKFLQDILGHVGHGAPYNMFTRNCRHFVQDWFDNAPGKEVDVFDTKNKSTTTNTHTK